MGEDSGRDGDAPAPAWRGLAFKVASLSAASFGLTAIGFGISLLNTRILGPEAYGALKFLVSMINLLATLVHLGLFRTACTLFARSDDAADQGALTAACLGWSGVASLAMTAAVGGLVLVGDRLFGPGSGAVLLLGLPVAFALVWRGALWQILEGLGRIHLLAAFKLAPQLAYFIALAALAVAGGFSLATSFYLQFGLLLAVGLLVAVALRPRRRGALQRMGDIWSANRGLGLQIYLGSLGVQPIGHLIPVLIAGVAAPEEVGFYVLAMTVSSPLMTLVVAVATSLFRDFARRKAIGWRVWATTLGLAGGGLVGFTLLCEPVFKLLYPESFLPAVPYAKVLALGMALTGIANLTNRFLMAHGRGSEMRNIAIATGLTQLVGTLVLLPVIGIIGAAWAKVAASLCFVAGAQLGYLRLRAQLRAEDEG